MIVTQEYLNSHSNCPKCPRCGSTMTYWLKTVDGKLIFKCFPCKMLIPSDQCQVTNR